MFVLVVFDRPRLLDLVQCVLTSVMKDCPLGIAQESFLVKVPETVIPAIVLRIFLFS